MNVFRQLLRKTMTTCVPRTLLIAHGPRSIGQQPRLALTFDDGPHPAHTPRLLDCLHHHGLRATFYVIGANAQKYPELIRRMAAAGHEVANHTYTHSEPRQTSASVFLNEVRTTDNLLKQLIGTTTTTMRPPKGELGWSKCRGLWQQQKAIALWNVDAKDYRMQSADEMLHWCNKYQPRDGDILLFHDNHPYATVAVEHLAAKGIFQKFETSTVAAWIPSSSAHRTRAHEEKSRSSTRISSPQSSHYEQGKSITVPQNSVDVKAGV